MDIHNNEAIQTHLMLMACNFMYTYIIPKLPKSDEFHYVSVLFYLILTSSFVGKKIMGYKNMVYNINEAIQTHCELFDP